MTKQLFFTILLTSLLALSTCTSSSSSSMVAKRGGFRLCGARLVETLTMICGGEFYGPNLVGRDLGDEGTADPYSLWLLGLPSKSSNVPSRLGRRQMIGVVDECCLKSCSYSVLASYCSK